MPKQWKLISLLGGTYIMPTLASLSEGPRRFSDLTDVYKNERTRTDKLRKSENANLITTVSKKAGERTFIHYLLTGKGFAVFRKVQEIG